MDVDYRILGPFEVVVDGQPVRLGGGKEQSVLAILLLHANRVVSMDRLIDLLWGEDPPVRAVNTVQTYVSRIRKAVQAGDGAILETVRPGYRLAVGEDAVDANRFTHLLEEGRTLLTEARPDEAAATLRKALELWRGTALAGFEYLGFADQEMRRLGELRLSALEAVIAADLECGRNAGSIVELERLTEQHPLRERFWAQLMLALYRDGRQAEALRAFTTARTVLREELGIDPSAELLRLEERILAQDPELHGLPRAAGGRRETLPADATSFVGRAEEAASIVDLLSRVRLVTLLGVGGVGKSRLARQVARLTEQGFADGARLVDLSGLADPDHVPAAVTGALGREPDGNPARLLAGHQLLLILDNCDTVIEGAAGVAEAMLAAAPGVRIIATSRRPLEASGEVLWRVSPLGVPDRIDGPPNLEELSRIASVRLFCERAAAADPRFELTAEAATDVAAICRLLEGVPLAVELAAARMRHMTLAEILAGLDDRFSLLIGGGSTTTPRHRALHAAIEWSYEQLEPTERDLFGRLGVFFREFPPAAPEVVCSGGGIAADDVPELLARLVDRSLVTRVERSGRTWYRLLDTLGQFALEQIADRYLHHHTRGFVIEMAQGTDPRLRGSEERMWAVLLDGDREVSGAALEVAGNDFREDQGAFLAGVASARTTQTGVVAFLGAMTADPPAGDERSSMSIRRVLRRFRDGFVAGVAFADPSVRVAEAYLTQESNMLLAFRNPMLGRRTAADLYAQGADVVFQAAGESGRRIFEAARRAHETTGTMCWGVGVDRDEYLFVEPALRDYVLGSVVKQIPMDVYGEVKAWVAGGRQGPLVSFDLANEGLRLSTTGGHLARHDDELQSVRAGIIDGEIDVSAAT